MGDEITDSLDEADYYVPVSRTYVGARVEGRVALYTAHGYLYWTSTKFSNLFDASRFPSGLRGAEPEVTRWYALSNFQQRDDSTPTFDELRTPCPEC